MTLLSTIQRAAVLSDMPRPAAAATATDGAVAKMVELARLDAEELAARSDWSATVRTHSFVTVVGIGQPGGLPADYARMTYRGQIRQAQRRWTLTGPTPRAEWDRLVDFPAASYPSAWRIFGGRLEILPRASAGEALHFDYVTRNLFRDKDGNAKATWDADADVCLLPEDVIALGVIWRWRALKGLDYGEHMITAENAIARATGNDGGGKPVLQPVSRLGYGDSRPFPGVIGGPGTGGNFGTVDQPVTGTVDYGSVP